MVNWTDNGVFRIARYMYVNKFPAKGRGQEEVAGSGTLLMLVYDVLTVPYSYANVVWFSGSCTALGADLGCQWSQSLDDGTDGRTARRGQRYLSRGAFLSEISSGVSLQ
jgi:hypothetical protein